MTQREQVGAGAPLIHHIGILVPNIKEAIELWSAATGYTFSPIHRYRTESYVDQSDPIPHQHDGRFSFSKEGRPYIELMEFHGKGTHSVMQGEGFHHIGIVDYPDVDGRLLELAEAGFGDDGKNVRPDGHVLLCFTNKAHLNGVRLEYISQHLQPVVRDDGSEPFRDVQGRLSFWPPEKHQ